MWLPVRLVVAKFVLQFVVEFVVRAAAALAWRGVVHAGQVKWGSVYAELLVGVFM